MIRVATLQDVPAVVALAQAFHRESAYRNTEFLPSKVTDLFSGLLDEPRGTLLVAEEGGVLIGFLSGGIGQDYFGDGLFAFEHGVYVVPERRGGMAGPRLVQAFLSWAEGLGVPRKHMAISTGIATERTGALYQHLGGENTGALYSWGCDMAWAPLVAMGVSAVGGIMSAKGQQDAGQASQEADYEQAQQMNVEAAQVRQAAKEQAEKIRKAGRTVQSQARAAYGASGVSVDVGTPVEVGEQIEQDAESDAYAAILSGRRQAKNLDYQADMTRRHGSSAAAAGNTAATASLLSTAGNVYGQWRKGSA
ncbi:GNAT family N-acetyltransferase [Achromobacter spanius]|uniref:virion core protein, T7 gp14 family n=1 Tax=Achromobacter spanius TaxID=217203 RepID=UPI000F8FB7B1|nr:GNAT family N-acetyltransferase [Achromobacter spanius]AZS78843.1 GNAT family N-acetyltransferase [Achromobacter spanius]